MRAAFLLVFARGCWGEISVMRSRYSERTEADFVPHSGEGDLEIGTPQGNFVNPLDCNKSPR